MRNLTCAQLEEIAAELAFDVLGGDERGSALAHVDRCASCRQEVVRSAELLDTLLLLAPPIEPPDGFEARVLAQVNRLRPRYGRNSPLRWIAAGAAAVVVALAAFLVSPPGGRDRPTSAFASTIMRTGDGEKVGTGYLHRTSPRWIFVSIPGWQQQLAAQYDPNRTYSLRVERRDKTSYTQHFSIGRDGSWASGLRGPTGHIASITIVDDQGHTWCSGRFR